MSTPEHNNTDLLTEIAVAYYQDGATQEEISKKFAVSRAKVGRMLKMVGTKASLKSR
ncbi:transcriptional regulator SorC family [Vibrio astriarenae]|nr:transcriptional regulator SorC family [Vibrio sp. C7]